LAQTLSRALRPLGLDEVVRHQNAGAQVLDVRPPVDFARHHLVGSVNISLSGAYATWAGTVLDQQQPIVLVAEPGQEEEAAMRLGRIGFDHVVGYLEGGAQVWRLCKARPATNQQAMMRGCKQNCPSAMRTPKPGSHC